MNLAVLLIRVSAELSIDVIASCDRLTNSAIAVKWGFASPVKAMNGTLSRYARSIARKLTMPCEYVSKTALGSIDGARADAPTSSLR